MYFVQEEWRMQDLADRCWWHCWCSVYFWACSQNDADTRQSESFSAVCIHQSTTRSHRFTKISFCYNHLLLSDNRWHL